MKAITIKSILSGLLLCFLSVSAKGNVFHFNEVRISLDVQEITLDQVLEIIESKTTYKFFYKNADIDLTQKITFKAKNKPLHYVLSELLKEKDVHFKILKNQIVLKKSVLELHAQQTYIIEGKVIDQQTGKSVYNCNVALGNTYTGTATNELGEFVIKTTSIPVELIFSHLNYDSHTVVISDTKALNVSLTPLVNTLEEVVISGTDQYAIDLARKAFNKTAKSSVINKFGRAFYRQTSKNDDDYSEFSEIIYDIQYSTSGIEDWDIIEGRYAVKEEKVNNKNYTLLSRLLKAIQPNTEDIFFPLNRDLDKFYKIRTLQKIKSKNNVVAVLWFEPREKNAITPLFEGEVYIDTKTFDVLKVTGEIARDDLDLIRLTEKNTAKTDYTLSYEMAFKVDSILGLAIDYIDVHQEFDYYKDQTLQTHVSSKSSLNFFEYYTPTSRKKLGRQFKRNTSDWYRLNEIGYNKKFWKDNPIVKRTSVEEEVISSFEKDNAFESIFLNSRNQITEVQSDISNDPFIQKLDIGLGLYNNYSPIEKVYLHTDKAIFSPGEDIWFSAYTVLGPIHHYSLASKVLYVDLISPDGLLSSSQKIELTAGKGNGVIQLPDEHLKSGIYQLRAYTNWMRNEDTAFFFTKNIHIIDDNLSEFPPPIKEDSLDFQFFPEGGHIVSELHNTIAFKAIGPDGLGKAIKGTIVDSKGIIVTHINSLEKGAGLFSLNPKKGETYAAILENKQRIPLPNIQDEGYVLSVDNRNERSIRVKVQASKTLKEEKIYIIGHIRNQKFYQAQLGFGGKEIIDFEIPKIHLTSGVMTLTLFDKNMVPWCERVLFINNQEELVISASINKTNFKARKKTTMDIEVTDPDGRPVSTDLSVAITDADKVIKQTDGSNILTHLLLESDLKGHIENPAFYFKDIKTSTRSRLDLIMLTHGWRKFDWEAIRRYDIDSIKPFPFAKGLEISGIVQDKKNVPLKNTRLDMIAKSSDNFRVYSSKTNLAGRFNISNFNHSDSTEITFKVYNDRDAIIDATVLLDERKEQLPLSNFKSYLTKITLQDQDLIQTNKLRKKSDSIFNRNNDFTKGIALNEILLKGKGAEKKRDNAPSFYGIEPDASLVIDEKNNLGDLIFQLARLPGVAVLGTGREARVSIQRSDGPLWIIDGVPVFNENAPIGSSGALIPYPRSVVRIPSVISRISLLEVEKIEVLRPSKAAVYGSRGFGGVISIKTRRGNILFDNTATERKSLWTHTVNGYSGTKEFYSPKYDVKKPEHERLDYRTTLFWTPQITTDKNGKASITFFNSDITKRIQVSIEGLSTDGAVGTYLKKYGNE